VLNSAVNEKKCQLTPKVFVLFEEVRSLQSWFCSQVECIILKNEVSGMVSYQRLTDAME
jgi:hypothetical protein